VSGDAIVAGIADVQEAYPGWMVGVAPESGAWVATGTSRRNGAVVAVRTSEGPLTALVRLEGAIGVVQP
jgi:hypothetical protein